MPKGGPAGSEVLAATISAAPERLGGAGLGNILVSGFKKRGDGFDRVGMRTECRRGDSNPHTLAGTNPSS
jgi:hypothetical protein